MKEYLTTGEIAQKLNVSRETIRRYIRLGDLPAIKFRRLYRVKREDFDRFLKEHRTIEN